MLKAIPMNQQTLDIIAQEIKWSKKDISDFYESYTYINTLFSGYIIVDSERPEREPIIYKGEAFVLDYEFYEGENPLAFMPVVRKEEAAKE